MGIRHEAVVAHKLDASTQAGRRRRPSLDVTLRDPVLDGGDRILADPVLPERHHLGGRAPALVGFAEDVAPSSKNSLAAGSRARTTSVPGRSPACGSPRESLPPPRRWSRGWARSPPHRRRPCRSPSSSGWPSGPGTFRAHRRLSRNGGADGAIMNSCGSTLLSACTPPLSTLNIGTGRSAHRRRPGSDRGARARSPPPRGRRPGRRRGSRWRRGGSCRPAIQLARVAWELGLCSRRTSGHCRGDDVVHVRDGAGHALAPETPRIVVRRSSTVPRDPVDAPEGTAARPRERNRANGGVVVQPKAERPFTSTSRYFAEQGELTDWSDRSTIRSASGPPAGRPRPGIHLEEEEPWCRV